MNAQKSVLDNAVKLVIDQNAFNRLKEDIQNIVITDGSRKNTLMYPPLNPPNERKPSKGRLGLFETVSQPRENPQSSGGFFNFGGS